MGPDPGQQVSDRPGSDQGLQSGGELLLELTDPFPGHPGGLSDFVEGRRRHSHDPVTEDPLFPVVTGGPELVEDTGD